MSTTTKQYQLPRAFAEKWITALRSGEYKQGRGALGNKEIGYCCLGVAGILCGAKDRDYIQSDGLVAYLYSDDSERQIPAIIGIVPKNLLGRASTSAFVKELSYMNDHGKPFPEIADWIEENVEFI